MTTIESEIVILPPGRDDGLRAVEAMLSQAQRQADGPAAAEATVLRAISPTATRATNTQE